MRDFKCESAEFNGPQCRVQCESCKPVRVGRPARKHISEKTCHGKDVPCMQGLGGTCVACVDDD